jgi:hypothetical protein
MGEMGEVVGVAWGVEGELAGTHGLHAGEVGRWWGRAWGWGRRGHADTPALHVRRRWWGRACVKGAGWPSYAPVGEVGAGKQGRVGGM